MPSVQHPVFKQHDGAGAREVTEYLLNLGQINYLITRCGLPAADEWCIQIARVFTARETGTALAVSFPENDFARTSILSTTVFQLDRARIRALHFGYHNATCRTELSVTRRAIAFKASQTPFSCDRLTMWSITLRTGHPASASRRCCSGVASPTKVPGQYPK